MDNQSQLCPSCSSIDFKSAFALRVDVIRGVAITATRNDIQADCILCSCVVSMFSDINTVDRVSAIKKSRYHFRALDKQEVSKRLFKSHSQQTSDVMVAIVRGDSDQPLEIAQLMKAISLGLILPLAQGSALQPSEISGGQRYRGRIVNSLSPDFTRIRSWIDECHSLEPECHSKCKILQGNTTFQSRVIDCWTRQIVPLSREVEYLALSYVWGKATDDENSQDPQISGFVPLPAPQTIEDAMSVVRDMGKRYLWVDRYCVWRLENRHLQIQNMHEIYRNALSTIVPVEADSAGSGFSGVSSPRCDQCRFWTNAGLLVFTFPHISYQLLSSIWLTRGWTYQEAFLSRSCIFFTKDQVYFACRSGYWSEDVEQAPFSFCGAYQETLQPELLNYTDHLNAWYKSDSALFLYDHVKAYTSRSLTLDSDGLNAFEGIIKSVNTKSFWGIINHPLYHYSDHSGVGFAVGLAWYGLRKPPGGGLIRRREGFPTWSWVSLVDQIEHTLKTIASECKVVRCSHFYLKDENGHFARIAEIYKRTAGSGALLFSNFGKALFIEANITQVHLLWSKQAGIYTVHAPAGYFFLGDYGPSPAPSRVMRVRARIDDDAGLLSNIESRPWSAVQLFGTDKKLGRVSIESEHYWMLVDEHGPVAHRVGIIVPAYDDRRWLGDYRNTETAWIRMGDLKAQRRLIKIE